MSPYRQLPCTTNYYATAVPSSPPLSRCETPRYCRLGCVDCLHQGIVQIRAGQRSIKMGETWSFLTRIVTTRRGARPLVPARCLLLESGHELVCCQLSALLSDWWLSICCLLGLAICVQAKKCMDTARNSRKCLTSCTNLRSPARHPTRTAAGSKDPAVSPRCTVYGTLGGVNYIHCASQLKESKSSEI